MYAFTQVVGSGSADVEFKAASTHTHANWSVTPSQGKSLVRADVMQTIVPGVSVGGQAEWGTASDREPGWSLTGVIRAQSAGGSVASVAYTAPVVSARYYHSVSPSVGLATELMVNTLDGRSHSALGYILALPASVVTGLVTNAGRVMLSYDESPPGSTFGISVSASLDYGKRTERSPFGVYRVGFGMRLGPQ